MELSPGASSAERSCTSMRAPGSPLPVEFLFGQPQVVLRRGELLSRRHQVEQGTAHVNGRLFGEVALAHAEFPNRRLLFLDPSLAAEAVEYRDREADPPVVRAHEVLRALAGRSLIEEPRERRQPLRLDGLDLPLRRRDLRVGAAAD